MSDRARWGILGTGGIARTFAAAVAEFPRERQARDEAAVRHR